MRKLPFVRRIFWKTLTAVVVCVVVGWGLYISLSGYKLEPQDYVGTVICTVLLSYLIHLWIMPAEDLHDDHRGES